LDVQRKAAMSQGHQKIMQRATSFPVQSYEAGGDRRRVAADAANKLGTKMGRKEKKEARRRMRRRDNGMAATAGISSAPKVEPITRTLALLGAALRVWEARNGHLQTRSVWRRRVNGEATRG
jgi:hypothetical protein